MIVSLVTPMLLQAAWWLPYTIAGLIAVLVSIFFFVRRIERKRQADCGNSGQTRMTMMEMNTMYMPFTTQESLSRMDSVYIKKRPLQSITE